MDDLAFWREAGRRHLARRNLFRACSVAAAAAGSIAITGCGTRGTNSGAGAKTAGEQPQKGGVLSHRLNTDVDPLDIHQATSMYAVWPEAPCYNQLLQQDPQDPDRKTIPDLADSYEIAGDGKSIVFKLHPGIKFHDGSDLTSDDIRANVDWLKAPPAKKVSPRQGVLDAVDHVELPDALTAKFVLKRPNPSLIANLASHYMAIGSKGDLVKGDLGTQMNGTGPFRLKNYARGIGAELERNADYWVRGRPFLGGLKYSLVADENTAFTDFIAGRFTRFFPMLPENFDRVAKETGGKARVETPLSLSRSVIFFNGAKKPYIDVRVREAVSLAVDRQLGSKVLVNGRSALGGYMLPGGQWAIPEDQLKKIPGYDKPDIAEAKKLLAAAGVTEPLTGVLLTRTDKLWQDQAEFVQGSLKKALGWDFRIEPKDNASAYAAAYAGQFDLISWTIGLAIDDPDAAFSETATSRAVRNWSKVYDTDADGLFDKQTVTVDYAQRKQIVQEMETKFLNDFQFAVMSFAYGPHALWNSIRNYRIANSLFTNQRYQDVWLNTA